MYFEFKDFYDENSDVGISIDVYSFLLTGAEVKTV
ncbi:hypothetical protein UAW_01672 [Enterococcus haemoperoxidus ATCC BAA-382]|uniref:Uncharacterized protein n=1 Tax=Enterococcus haemoperoxidus ATCC BAA-382 TaxID=1158608 RepID=R2SPN5_9ENTE|nr:hypothetical protein UAW_01672 [Enterococcus haemoperoxidus ATCC BAA-382]EOT60003.1 hypothetical protein I583_02638 [Enterococcus haemoperoxidus ATCC BAA-382]